VEVSKRRNQKDNQKSEWRETRDGGGYANAKGAVNVRSNLEVAVHDVFAVEVAHCGQKLPH
jgi:hypothetical protein